MTTIWEIEEGIPPEEPPAATLVTDEAAGELTAEDLAAAADGVVLAGADEGIPT